MCDVIRWRPRPGVVGLRGIDTRIDHTDADGETFYRAWPEGRQEPPGNPVKWSESTLRICYERVED